MKSLMNLLTVLLAVIGFEAAAATPVKPTVAVLYFDVHESLKAEQVFQKGLAEMLITDLVQTDLFSVVERSRLEDVLTELKLQKSAAVDQATAQKAGKLLGAKYLILGSIIPLGKKLSFETRVLSVETAKVLKSTRAQASMDDVFEAEQQLAQNLQRLLLEAETTAQAAPTPASPAPAKPPAAKKKTVLSFFTAAKFAGALDAKDNHDLVKAKELLTQVTAEAPTFELAKLDLANLTK